ncbi:Transposase domain [Nitrosomonas sp. Nm51]|nr:Transposase domain [Nitrosomonas sp. Nm51]
MVCNIPTTRMLLDRLAGDITLRRICGWERINDVPHESTFSRAFDEFSRSRLPQPVHKTFIRIHYANEIVGHILTALQIFAAMQLNHLCDNA